MRDAQLFRKAIFFLFEICLVGAVNPVGANAQTILWSNVEGPYAGLVQLLTVNPQGNIFAATSAGMYRSTDNGKNWQASGFSLEFGADALGIDSSSNAYAGNLYEGLFESTDNGISWSKTSLDSGAQCIATISGNRICAGKWATVAISKDNGKTWTSSQVPSDYPVPVLSIAEDSAGNIYAGLKAYPASKTSPPLGGGIYISSDSGKTWELYGFFNITISSISISRTGKVFLSTGWTVYSAPLKSSHWTQNAAGLPPNILSLQTDHEGEVVAATDNSGIFVYDESLQSWKRVVPSISSSTITSAFYDPDGTTYAGTARDGIYFFDKESTAWIQCGAYPAPVTAVSFDGSGDLFAGVQGGVYERPASDKRWKRVSNDLRRGDIYRMHYAPASKRLYLASSDGLFYLPDNENSWIPSIKLWAYDYVEVPDSHYAFIGSTGGIYKGFYDLWNSYSSTIGLPTTKIYSVVTDASNNLYAGTRNDGVFVSTDGGTFWLETGINDPIIFYSVKTIAIDGGGRIFAGTDSAGAYYSDDGGKNWEYISTISGSNVTCFLVPKEFPISGTSEYFAGTADGGVFVSTDRGLSWKPANNGLTDSNVSSLLFDTQGNLYAGTSGGLFKSSIMTGVTLPRNSQPSSFSLSQNYPNPFNPTTDVRFTIADFRFVTLTVYDVLGRVVKTLVNENKSPGMYEVSFDGSTLSSGTYFYWLTAGDYIETKKMVLLR